MKGRLVVFVGLCICFAFPASSQKIMKKICEEDISDKELASYKEEFGNNKTIPEKFEKPILVALSYYPELKDIKIKFKIKKKSSPLMARPGFWSTIFNQPHNRTYFVIISSKTDKYLEHTELANLPLNAQIGVVGHELAHVVDFSQRSIGGILNIAVGNLSSRWLDKFEFNTDRKTIDHGLGYQLLAWSVAVRSKIYIEELEAYKNLTEAEMKSLEEAGKERYMNPGTIVDILAGHPLYEKVYGRGE